MSRGGFQGVKLIKLENNVIHDNKRFGKARWFGLKETSKNSPLKAQVKEVFSVCGVFQKS